LEGAQTIMVLDLESTYFDFLMRYFVLMRRDEKEDIILDYLLRFNTFLEQHYKRFLLVLSKNEDSTDTIGALHRLLGKERPFLRELRNMRNAMSHGTFSINVDDADILKSKIEFTCQKWKGPRKITKSWAECVEQCETIYDIVIGLDRYVKQMLIDEKLIKIRDEDPIDVPSNDLFQKLIKQGK
nr:hypothetical protein [Candidatus Sigynarchaeota archaeon]